MLWFYLCFSEEGHIRVANLKNHLRQNNAFTKLFYDEHYLPGHQRLHWSYRLVRFMVYILTALAITAQFAAAGLSDVEAKIDARTACARSCQVSHYPILSCGLADMSVWAGGNLYRKLYHYNRPVVAAAPLCVDDPIAREYFGADCMSLFNAGRCSGEPVLASFSLPADAHVADEAVLQQQALEALQLFGDATLLSAREEPWDAEPGPGFGLLFGQVQHILGTPPPPVAVVLDVSLGTTALAIAQELSADRAHAQWASLCELVSGFADCASLAKVHVHATVSETCRRACGTCPETVAPASDAMQGVEQLQMELKQGLSADLASRLPGLSTVVSYVQEAAHRSMPYLGLMHDSPLVRDFAYCRELAQRPPSDLREINGRVERLHTCFSACRDVDETPKGASVRDSRPACAAIGQAAFHELLCVSPEDRPEDVLEFWGGVTEFGDNLRVSWVQILCALCVIGAVQTVTEFCMYWTADITETDFVNSTRTCLLQFVLIVNIILLCMLTIGPFNIAGRLRMTDNIVLAFCCVLIADQMKNMLVQPVLWFFVTKRCGRVEPGIQEYNQEYLAMWEPQPSLMNEARQRVIDVVDSKPVTMGIIALVGVYAVFVLANLLLADMMTDWPVVRAVFRYTDWTVVSIFCFECAMKTFAYGLSFWMDKWNFADNTIVVFSFAMMFYSQSKGIGLLRLLRLLRVMLIYRKVSETRKKLKNIKQKSSVNVGSNVDKVLELIDELQASKAVSQTHKDELDWVSHVIISNGLYNVSMDADGGQDGSEQNELNAWINVLDAQPEKPDRELPRGRPSVQQGGIRLSKINPERSGSRAINNPDGDGEDDQVTIQLYELANVTSGEEMQFECTLASFDEWNHDLHQAVEMMEVNLLPIIFIKLCLIHDFLSGLSLDVELLFNACQQVQVSYHPHVLFHNAAHTASMLHALHYFTNHGLNDLLPSFELFTLFFSALAVHFSHPGLSSEFLIKTRHPRALRYNDQAVIENYNMSRTAMMLMDPECNFLVNWETSRCDQFRQILIKVVLSMDISKHFQNLSVLNTKLSSDSYPSVDSPEDMFVLMATSLRCADLSWACKGTHSIFTRRAEKFMDEMFAQGDVEKQVGVSVSPFADRDLVTPQKAQLAFLLVIVAPIMNSYSVTLPSITQEVIDEGLDNNRQILHSKVTQGR